MRKYMLIAAGVMALGLAVNGFADGCHDGAKAEEAAASELKVATVDTEQVKAAVAAGDSVIIVDTRTAEWDDGKRIPGAIYVPADASEEEIAAALPDKSANIVAYCSNLKCTASDKFAKRLHQLGYENVVKYPEGLAGWVEAGQSVVETKASEEPES